MTLFFEKSGVEIHHADSLELDLEGDLLLADPPYGISYKSGHNAGYKTPRPGWDYRRAKNWPQIQGDDEPFDPSPWLRFPKMVFFGANYFASRLPDSRCWITWDKKIGKPDSHADCELAWTNFGKPSRIFSHLWRGICRAGEENVSHGPKLHANQKPVDLMRRIIQYSGTTGPIVDPYCGSGPVLLAAFDLGMRAVGVDIDEACCEIAAKRLEARVFQHRLDA